MIKFVKLKQRFDVVRLQEEVANLESPLWKSHYNLKHYEGEWTTLPLRSINGDINNHVSIQGYSLQKNMAYANTFLLEKSFYVKSVINFFKCEKLSVRLMNLHTGATIKEHTDYDMNFENGEVRFHIPITTNAGVAFFIEDEKIPMNAGECWYLNLSLKHSVNNFGNTNRVHLVVDCKVNEWIKNLLQQEAELTGTIDENDKEIIYSASDKSKIIEQLRMMGTPTANEMADKLQAEK